MALTGKFGSLFGDDGESEDVLGAPAEFGLTRVDPIIVLPPAKAMTAMAVEAGAIPMPAAKKVSRWHNLLVKLHLVKP